MPESTTHAAAPGARPPSHDWTQGAVRWTGTAHVYGHDVDTDVLYPGRHLAVTDSTEMAKHAAEDLDPDFRTRVRMGDLFVAGRNLGCGSSREQAPIALRAAGVRAVVCGGAARIFFRNAINQGLPILRIGPDAIDELRATVQTGDALTVDLGSGTVTHPATGRTWQATPLPPELRALVDDGGLIPHLKKRLAAATPEA